MKGMSGLRTWLLILLGIGVSACAADGSLRLPAESAAPYPPPGYKHRVASSHVELYWNCSNPEPNLLRLDGVAVNPWSDQPVRFLEFELAGVSANERTVSEAKAEARDIQIFTNQSSPFRMDLRMAGGEVRYDLFYQYRFQDGDHYPVAARLVSMGPFLLAQRTNRFMVRDACSETQHLAR